ncbi:MAG: T9SS type A sorting domain-containing protein, partial [bacterium]|nr:T9SS type A sorting domain-containing protein [bacterium]
IIGIIECPDSQIIDSMWTWKSDTVFSVGLSALNSTNLIKNDGIDRIYGAPNPYTTVSESYGWFYMESDSDNSYYFAYEDTEDVKTYAMDFGYIDNDSLLDVLAGRGGRVWEAIDTENDSFLFADGTAYGGYLSKILEDIDKDGNKEYITGGLVYAQSPAEWILGMSECNGDNSYDTIWSHWIRKDYGPVSASFSGCGGDYGDIDGDGDDELVLCAGSIIEVFEVAGDDSFEMVWSMDNDTFSGSHVLVYDFTGNGRDEIIWTGQSDPQLPLTYGMEVMKTYIIEWDTLYDENKPTLDSAVAYEGSIVGDGIDGDDIVCLYFNRSMDSCTVNKGNIDEVLKLSSSHTWLDGTDSLGAVWWNSLRTRMFVKFKTNTEKPTISVGDTIRPDSVTINGSAPYIYPCYNEVILKGDFGPEGIWDSTCTVPTKSELQMQIQNQYILWNTNTQGTLTVYDISGREVIKEESKTTGEHKTNIRDLKNGIYFIKLNTKNQSITEKYLILR